MEKVGVVGAGVIGSGVAQNLAQEGFKVVLVDVSDNILENSRKKILENIRFYALFKKGEKSLDKDALMERIKFSTNIEELGDAEFVIENAKENWEVKRDVYLKLDSICQPDCIFGVNTSAISITKVGSVTKRPDKIIGIHFMNPVPLKSAVEVIKGYHTSENTIEITKMLLSKMGKECIVVEDFPGFVSNRISHLFMNEAAFVVQDGVASPSHVDEIFRKCFSHKMGPLETADLIGLDTVANTLDVLFESYNDPKYRCCPMLKKMVSAGLLGMKSGQGFYTYEKRGLNV